MSAVLGVGSVWGSGSGGFPGLIAVVAVGNDDVGFTIQEATGLKGFDCVGWC